MKEDIRGDQIGRFLQIYGSCGDYQPYLNELCFRYNRRYQPAQFFTRLSKAVAISRALLI